jgi:hypothetical protein
LPVHDVQICNATGLAAGATLYDPTTWVPQADIDTGLLDVYGLPFRRGVDSWDLLKEVVGAEYGIAGFSESGRFFFVNRDNARRGNLTVEKIVTDEQLITDISLAERTGAVRNTITARLKPRFLAAWTVLGQNQATAWDVVFKLVDPEQMVCGPGSSAHQIKLDVPAWIFDGAPVHQETTANWPPDSGGFQPTNTKFVAVRQGQLATEQPGVVVTQTALPVEYGHDQVLIQVFNPGIYPVVFATTNGDPAFWVYGRKYKDDTESELSVSRASSIARYGSRILELPDSDWIQRESSIGTVTRGLLKDLRAPVPTVDNMKAVGDVRLQLQDTLLVQDSPVLGGPMYTTLAGIQRVLNTDPATGAAKLEDSLTVRPFGAPGKWILGHPQWGILGQTTKL